MKIVLLNNSISDHLEHGREYIVYAIYITTKIEYMVMVDSYPSIPFSIDANDVSVVDNRLSRHWVFPDTKAEENVGSSNTLILSFPEWANDPYFFQHLVEGGDTGVIWRKYQEKMDLEFATSTLHIRAKILDSGWIQCESCLDAWQIHNQDEVVVCPRCHTRQLKEDTC